MSRAAIAAVVLLGACGATTRGVHGADPGDAIIYFDSNVKDATMWVDGIFVGGLGTLGGGIALDPGEHLVEIRHDDYFAYYAELDVKRGERKRIPVQLAPVLP
jgi:hypothetical protein